MLIGLQLRIDIMSNTITPKKFVDAQILKNNLVIQPIHRSESGYFIDHIKPSRFDASDVIKRFDLIVLLGKEFIFACDKIATQRYKKNGGNITFVDPFEHQTG